MCETAKFIGLLVHTSVRLKIIWGDEKIELVLLQYLIWICIFKNNNNNTFLLPNDLELGTLWDIVERGGKN